MRATDPDHGMPADVAVNLRSQNCLKSSRPNAPTTVRRWLANWVTQTKRRGLDGPLLSGDHLGHTKTTNGEQDDAVHLTGRPVDALNEWIASAMIEGG